jgi:hypothetical protein
MYNYVNYVAVGVASVEIIVNMISTEATPTAT